MLTELLEYRFESSLLPQVTHELHLLTGMLIGDVSNPYKDTPGSGILARTVYLTLERGELPDDWYLTAFTHDLPGDLTPVALLHARLHLVLPNLVHHVQELLVSSALPPITLPEDRAGLEAFATAMFTAGQYDRAVADLTCALALAPSDGRLVGKRAVCLHKLGRIDDALIDFTRAIELLPGQGSPYAARASVYAEQGRHLDALADLDNARSLEPDKADHRVKAGILYYQLGSLAASVDEFSAALKLQPEEGDIYYFRGCAEWQLGHLEQAADDFGQAQSRSSSLKQADISDVLINRVATLGRLLQPEALEQAVYALTELLEKGVQDPSKAELYMLRADFQQRLHKLVAALDDCERSLLLSPANPLVYNVKGIAHAGLKQMGDALSAFRQAILLAPDDVNYVHNLAITLGHMERYDDALAEYRRAILLNPHSAPLYSERGEMHAALGNDALARTDYDLALRLAPEDLPTMLRLGALLSRQGDPTAEQYLNRVIGSDNSNLRGIAENVRRDLDRESTSGQRAAPILLPDYKRGLAPPDVKPKELAYAA